MNIKKLLFLVACLCTSVILHAQIRLSFNPTEGKTYLYRFTTEVNISQTIMGEEFPMNTKGNILMEMSVRENNGSEVQVDFTYKSMSMQASGKMMNFSFDSEADTASLSEEDRERAQLFSAFIGTTLSVVFGADGSVKSIDGIEAFNQLIARDPITQGKQVLINENEIMQMFGSTFTIFPSHKVEVGDSWISHISLLSLQGMETEAETTFTLVSISEGIASIDMVSVLATTSGDIEMSGESGGKIKLDIDTGLIIYSSQSGEMNGIFADIEGMTIEMAIGARSRQTAALER